MAWRPRRNRRPKAAETATEPDDGPLDLELERSEYRGTALDEDGLEPQDAEVEDLRDHLLWQLNLTPMSARDRAIAADDHRRDRRRRLPQRVRRVDPGKSRLAAHDLRRGNRIGAPSRAALRSGRRRQPHAARMPRRAARYARLRRYPGLRSRARSSTSISKRSRGRIAAVCASACTRPKRNSRPRSR